MIRFFYDLCRKVKGLRIFFIFRESRYVYNGHIKYKGGKNDVDTKK